jgi:hypothetical protein
MVDFGGLIDTLDDLSYPFITSTPCLWRLERYIFGLDIFWGIGFQLWWCWLDTLNVLDGEKPCLDGIYPSTQGRGLWRPNISYPSSNNLLKVPNVSLEGVMSFLFRASLM